jgi:hypothetical protein
VSENRQGAKSARQVLGSSISRLCDLGVLAVAKIERQASARPSLGIEKGGIVFCHWMGRVDEGGASPNEDGL